MSFSITAFNRGQHMQTPISGTICNCWLSRIRSEPLDWTHNERATDGMVLKAGGLSPGIRGLGVPSQAARTIRGYQAAKPLILICSTLDAERVCMTRRMLFLLPAAAALNGAQAGRPAGGTSWVEEAAKTEARIRSWAAAQDDYAILVDKQRYDLYVLLGVQAITRLPVELGHDPVNRKEREGDMRTPEGVYSVVFRREKGSSFYKDLMLDYPNKDDRRLGRTGSAMEIHGSGTGHRPTEGGQNWTFGCIALSNGDVDYLLKLAHGAKRIRKGTPVGIVRSLAQALPVTKAALP